MSKSSFQILSLTAICIFVVLSSVAIADDFFVLTDMKGDVLIREAGEHIWQRPMEGQFVYAGDRFKLRSGEIQVEFPQATLHIFDKGEVLIPGENPEEQASNWRKDLQLFIGSYGVDLHGDGRIFGERISPRDCRITLITLFGRIEAKGHAKVHVNTTLHGSKVDVLEGKVTIYHRWEDSVVPRTLVAGQTAEVSLKDISTQPKTTNSAQQTVMILN